MLGAAACSLFFFCASTHAQTAHFSGATATVDSIFTPFGMAVDSAGDVFVADQGNSAVKEIVAVNGSISSSSTVITIGSGFYYPAAVAVDSAGDVFVADALHNAVKEIVAVNGSVSSSSTVNTVGSGFNEPYAVAVDSAGNVFVADYGNNAMKEIVAVNGSVSSSSTVNTIGSGFYEPYGVAVDSAGDVFVGQQAFGAQQVATAVKEIVAVNGAVSSSSTVISVGSGFYGAGGMAVDSIGDVFVEDTGHGYLKEIVAVNGSVSSSSTVLTVARATSCFGVALDSAGHIFYGAYNAVQEYMTGGSNFGSLPVATSTPQTIPLTFTFDSSGQSGMIGAPAVLTQGSTGLDFTDAGTGTCTTQGTSHTYNMGDTCTIDVKFTPTRSGNRYGAATLRTTSGVTIATGYVHGIGVAPQVAYPPGTTSTIGSGFFQPYDVAVDSAGDVFVADFAHHAVKEIVAVGGAVSSSSTVNTVGSGFSLPIAVAVDGAGNVFVADYSNNAVYEIVAVGGAVSSSSTVNTVGSGFNSPSGVAVDSAGNVFVADFGNNAVKEIVALHGVVSSSSTVVTIGSGFNSPSGVAVDSAGNVFVGDFGNNAVKEIVAVSGAVSSSSTVITVGSGFSQPFQVALDSAGDVFVADYSHTAVKEIVAVNGAVSSSSTVNTIFSDAYSPEGVAVDSAGNVFVAVSANNTVSKVDLADAPSLSFATTVAGSTSSDSPQTVTVTNNGNAALTFEVPSTGLNPSISADFTLGNSSTCPQLSIGSTVETLAPGASCTEIISFAPITSGAKSGSLVTTDNALNAAGPTYATQTISLSGTAIPAVSASTSVASTALTQNHAAIAFTPVTGSGGTAPLTYSVSPSLPAGLSFSSSTGAVSGTPTAVSAATTYTVTVTDANSLTAMATFSLTVHIAVAASTAIPSTALTQSHAVVAFTPVTGSGGTAPLIYSVSPTLPAGLSFSSSGLLTGTPTAVSAATTYTVTVTDANSATAMATFSLAVNIAISASTTIASTALTQSHAASAFTPVTGSGGTAPLTYSVSPTLPAGLSFSSAGLLTGTPTAVSAATTYTVTVTDANGATATATFSLTVNIAVSASTIVATTSLTQSHAASAFTPVTGSGGTAPLTYSVSPTLPAGLSFSSAGVLSGTPTASSAATTYTVTVTDANGATATATFSLTVNIAISASTAVPSTALTQNHAAIAFTPVTGSGGTAPLTYSVSPSLPAGLSFSSAGLVTGTPTAISAATTYTVTVTDANGATATAPFSLTVNIAVSASTSIPSTTLTESRAASLFKPVIGSGGTAPLTYSVSPTLPAGLSFSSAGVVSGTPSEISAATTYTVTVTDANSATATATFSLTVDSVTSTAIASSSLTPTYGETVVLTATVVPASTDTPPGTVRFFSGSTSLGTAPLNSTGVATLSTALPLGQDTITAVYSGSANYAGSTSGPILISDRGVTSVTFSATPPTQLYSNPIVLTAQAISPTAGTLSGTMSFLDGTTVIATVPLGANGQATYTATTLADGSHALTAAYSGDPDFEPGVSAVAPAAITVDDIDLKVAAGQTRPIVPGAAAAYTLQLSSLVTPTFLYDVHLTATGLPAGATYTLSPAMIPAGSASLPVTLTVQTVRRVASLTMPTAPGRQNSSRALTALAFGLLLPLFGAKTIRRRLKAMPGPLAVILFAALCVGLMAGLTGCGGGGFYGPTSNSGSYTITVTATSANLVRTTTVQLTIQ
jgi:DNA-binding beta-propeller fold protein YncE